MKTVALLRIAAVLTLLLCAGHSFGSPWAPVQAGTVGEVLGGMRAQHFAVMGVSRSYWDFYYGFGWSLSVCFLMQAALLWQLASCAKTHAAQVRPLAATLGLGMLCLAALAGRFIFPAPAIMTALIGLLALLASLRRTVSPAAQARRISL